MERDTPHQDKSGVVHNFPIVNLLQTSIRYILLYLYFKEVPFCELN